MIPTIQSPYASPETDHIKFNHVLKQEDMPRRRSYNTKDADVSEQLSFSDLGIRTWPPYAIYKMHPVARLFTHVNVLQNAAFRFQVANLEGVPD